MECQSSDSKKLTKVFDASLRKRSKKKRDGFDDTNSVVTDDSALGCLHTSCRAPSEKASLPEMSTTQTTQQDMHVPNKRDSSPSQAHSPVAAQRSPVRSRRKHRRPVNEGISLALKAGLVSTPRTVSPNQEREGVAESIPQDQDSFIYAFLEEAIKRDKKKQRQARRKEERRASRDRDASPQHDRDHARERTRERDHDRKRTREHDHDRERTRERDHDRERTRERDHDRERTRERGRDRDPDTDRHRHHHRRREEPPSRDHDRQPKDDVNSSIPTAVNQALLFETFAKMCAQFTKKDSHYQPHLSPVHSHSHKSLQCEVLPKKDSFVVDRQPVRLNSHSKSREFVANKIRSQENCSTRIHSREKLHIPNEIDRSKQEKYMYYYDKDASKYSNKMEMSRSRIREYDEERYRDNPPMVAPTRSCIDPYRRSAENRHYRDLDREMSRRYDDDKRKYCEQKTSRSFEVHREYIDDERVRRTARSDPKDRRYEERDKRYNDMPKYYDDKPLESRDRINMVNRERRWRKNLERFDRNSITSREDDRERDRYSERERDSGLSVADGDTSTVSGRSNCLKVVKQQISEQRDAMDKMMKLWKELMRCFKSIAQGQGQDKNVRESAANVQESAAEQMRLWWECMRRYETVARDVGDTDARLMEEIKKQRSEMAEMATMWQECLQRYRDISNDFNSLKQKLVTPESPTRIPAPTLLCPAEGEGSVATGAYRIPPTYPAVPTVPGMPNGSMHTGVLPTTSIMGVGYPRAGSPLHGRSSAPPAWWYCDAPNRSPRRRSSPDSRASRERDKDRKHRHREREDIRYKEKPSKPSAARSEHRHKKR